MSSPYEREAPVADCIFCGTRIFIHGVAQDDDHRCCFCGRFQPSAGFDFRSCEPEAYERMLRERTQPVSTD